MRKEEKRKEIPRPSFRKGKPFTRGSAYAKDLTDPERPAALIPKTTGDHNEDFRVLVDRDDLPPDTPPSELRTIPAGRDRGEPIGDEEFYDREVS